MTAPKGAGEILKERQKLDFVVNCLAACQAHATMTGPEAEQLRQVVRDRANDLFDEWSKIALELGQAGVALQYQTEAGAAQRLLYEFLNPELKRLPLRHRKFRPNRSFATWNPASICGSKGWTERISRRTNYETRSPPPGRLRQSQVITTFGPGAMLDLPNHSVLVGGLDYWTGRGEEIHEPRLTAKLQALLELPSLKLFSPPPDQEDPTAPQTGISPWQFPEWFITQDIVRTDGTATRSRRLVHRKALSKTGLLTKTNRNGRWFRFALFGPVDPATSPTLTARVRPRRSV